MSVPGRVLVFAAAVIVVAVGAAGLEAWLRQRDVRELRQVIAEIAAKSDRAEAAAALAGATANQAMDRAGQARTLAELARSTADQIAARAASAAAAAPNAMQQPASPVSESDANQGRNLALIICTACHVIAADQPLQPTLQPPAPDFHAIANRPATTENSLHDFLVRPHGKMPGLPLVDYQIAPLVSYILSLRDRH